MYRAPTVRKFLVASPADAVDGTSKEIYADSNGGSRGVWADGLGDRAGGGGFGIQHRGARSERAVAREARAFFVAGCNLSGDDDFCKQHVVVDDYGNCDGYEEAATVRRFAL